jgi:threonine aldolase
VALEESPAKLVVDHANARFLAEGLARIPGIQVDPAKVDTNIVVFDISASGLAPADVSARLRGAAY